ncbi:TIGR00266 family protein [Candidatus Bathyarchaeota archaeon]|nr:MAG: TIGR00266 family protein [Candidatus Bathyarchaeota archaeon]
MEYELIGQPAYTALKVYLRPGESVTSEAGAMMAIEGDVQIETHTAGGVAKGLLRRVLAGETLFLNTYTAGPGGGVVWLAPSPPGHIAYIPLQGGGIIVQDMSYLAHHGNTQQDIVWRGLRGMIAEGNLFWLRISGYGGVWVNSYGHVVEKTLQAGEKMIVDNFHFVAMSDTVEWNVRKFGSLKSFFFGGEGFVIDVEGPGLIYLQTRTMPELANLLRRFLGERSSGGGVSISFG